MPDLPTTAAPDAAEHVRVVLMAPALTSSQVDAAASAVASAGGSIVSASGVVAVPAPGAWATEDAVAASLPVRAATLQVQAFDLPRLRASLEAMAASGALDVAVVPERFALPGPRLVVMDVDSTLIQQEVIELLAAHAGREAEVAAITDRAMRGELDFAASLTERVGALAGLPVSVFDEVRAAVRLTPGAAGLARHLAARDVPVGIVSGGFLEVVGPLAARLGIPHVHANRLEVVDGRLTGRVDGPIVDRATKAAKLREWAGRHEVPLPRVLAVGDGANDLDMLASAGIGVAFNAKPAVRAQADVALNQPRLDLVLQLFDA